MSTRDELTDSSVEAVAAILRDPKWERTQYVYEWPEDEAEAYRALGWEEGRRAADAIRFRKQAEEIVAHMQGKIPTREAVIEALLTPERSHLWRYQDDVEKLATDMLTLMQGYGKIPTREQLEAVIDEYEDEAAEGHCDCGNYRIDPDELSARVWALLQGGPQ